MLRVPVTACLLVAAAFMPTMVKIHWMDVPLTAPKISTTAYEGDMLTD